MRSSAGLGVLFPIVVLATASQASASDPAQAMVFVRVFGDVEVEFDKPWKQPFAERDVEVATGSGFVIAPSGLDPDQSPCRERWEPGGQDSG